MKRIFWAVSFMIFSGLLFFGCVTNNKKSEIPAESSAGEGAKARVSSYIRTWSLPSDIREGDNPYWTADMINGIYLTDLIISFALIESSDGSSIYIPSLRESAEETSIFSNLWEEVGALKAKHPQLKVNISVGGWGAEGFSDMAYDAALKKAFIANVCGWLEQYDLDGVDIDWEYPVGPGWDMGIKTRPEDRENYVHLLRDIRAALDDLGAKTGKRYGLSAAVPASSWFVQANAAVEAADIVDGLKLMAYDYYGGWSSTTGHHANLSLNPKDPSGMSTRQAVDFYLNAGVPAHKLILGFGFYGRAWQGVADNGVHGLFQPFTSTPFEDGSLSYYQIEELLKPDSGYTRYWDADAEAPYLYNGDVWISYTDEEAIQGLTDFVKEKGLGGVFVWEYIHDKAADLLKVLAENVR
ncbi:MAG: glycoside hydrolase family 18 protein [Treponema sp.]|jgi:chitinase|nr:glycoside hydrolase family 18 protein [Treponema sp.]